MAKVYYISGLKSAAQIGLTFNGAEITAQSQPVLDAWGWDNHWGCEEWKAWFIELRKVMSAQDAALTFTQAWNQQDSFAGPYNTCKYNLPFRNFMRANGVNIDSIVSAIIDPLFDAAGNLVQGGSDVITNTAGAASSISQLIKPLAFIAVLGAGYYGYKTFIK